jgi:hypothetical protein
MWTGKAFVTPQVIRDRLTNKLRTTTNTVTIVPPEWYQRQLPANTYLDGTLWIDYGKSLELFKMFLSPRLLDDSDWSTVKFLVLDSPDHAIRDQPCLQRHKTLSDTIGTQTHVHVVEAKLCTDRRDFNEYFATSVQRGGEGLLVRDPVAPYLPGFPVLWWKKKVL